MAPMPEEAPVMRAVPWDLGDVIGVLLWGDSNSGDRLANQIYKTGALLL